MKTELKAVYDSRKSFYGKAQVEQEGDSIKLYSYNTLVCEIKQGKAQIKGFYSQTTLRHIKEFLLQNGFKVVNKGQLEKDYN